MQQSDGSNLDNSYQTMISTNNKNNKLICDDIMDELLNEVVFGVCLEVHRATKLGYLFLDEPTPEETKKYTIIDQKGLDIFGRVPKKKQYECVCPNCQRNLAASRFAPHLEKCMGMGRNSSRIASKRIANSSAKSGSNDSDIEDAYDNADSDWNYYSCSDSKKTKKKKEKNGNSNSNNFNNVQK